MFENLKNKKTKVVRVSTIVGQGTEIQGDISFSGGLHVDGIVKGNVNADQSEGAVLTLSELGAIEGEVRVPIVILNGSVFGNVFAPGRIELAPKSKVKGDITYNLIEMAVGAEINGRLLHKDEVLEESKISTAAVTLSPDLPKKERNKQRVNQVLTKTERNDILSELKTN